jgi:hypothetical protein
MDYDDARSVELGIGKVRNIQDSVFDTYINRRFLKSVFMTSRSPRPGPDLISSIPVLTSRCRPNKSLEQNALHASCGLLASRQPARITPGVA